MDAKKPTNPGATRSTASPRPAVKPASRPAGGKPASTKSATPSNKPVQPTSFMNWLGRQVGHVTSAVKTDVNKPAGKPASPKAGSKTSSPAEPVAGAATGEPRKPAAAPAGAGKGTSANSTGSAGGVVVYREDKVEEAEMPDRPGVILRRTIIDEVVVEVAPPKHEQ